MVYSSSSSSYYKNNTLLCYSKNIPEDDYNVLLYARLLVGEREKMIIII